MRNSAPIPHPDWLRTAMRDYRTTQKLYLSGMFPPAIEFFMVSTPIYRQFRCCFPNRWALLWWVVRDVIGHTAFCVRGASWRFWRYRILLKSQDADWHEMMTQTCPRCHGRHEIPRIGEDRYRCDGCHAEMDFGEVVMGQPEEEEDE